MNCEAQTSQKYKELQPQSHHKGFPYKKRVVIYIQIMY